MTQVLYVTAADLEREVQRNAHGEMEAMLLFVLGRHSERNKSPIVVRFDFPPDVGGFEMRFRRMGFVSRLLWWMGFGGKAVRP